MFVRMRFSIDLPMQNSEQFLTRFSSVARVLSESGLQRLQQSHVCIIGLGGVGSWCAEALARSAVGQLTLVDPDVISESNINRQIHSLSSSLGHAKAETLKQRITLINSECIVHTIEAAISDESIQTLLGDHSYDFIIDAIDSVRGKAAIVVYAKQQSIPCIITGGAGGLSDINKIKQADLSKTTNDALLAKLRSQLRRHHGYSRNTSKKMQVACIYSTEQQRYPQADGGVSFCKPGVSGLSLDCYSGYGSLVHITASFGLHAAGYCIQRLIKKSS
ncbi:MAG: tRNA threonylcarbamoyladenosine dehydratase [Gammaproteobacteria bacterium]|nr:tRNA threonylcarbamoyladenosine dehydratase [Gammaproteobacteria bacterium]